MEKNVSLGGRNGTTEVPILYQVSNINTQFISYKMFWIFTRAIIK